MKKKMTLMALVCSIALVVGLLSGFVAPEDAQKAPFDPGCEKLSGMTDEKVFAFLDYYEVEIPKGFAKTNEELAVWVRRQIQHIEELKINPVAGINFTDTNFFGTAIYEAVFEHYQWEQSMFWKSEDQ